MDGAYYPFGLGQVFPFFFFFFDWFSKGFSTLGWARNLVRRHPHVERNSYMWAVAAQWTLSLSRQFLCNARGSNLIKRSLGRREIQFSLCIHIYTSCCCCCWMQGAAAALLYPIYKERGEHAGLCDWRHSAYNPLLSLKWNSNTSKEYTEKKAGGGETSQLSIQLKNRSRPSKIRKSRTTILYVSLFLLSTDYIRWDDGTHMYVTEHSVPLTGRRRGRGKRRKKKRSGIFFRFPQAPRYFFFLSFFWLSV